MLTKAEMARAWARLGQVIMDREPKEKKEMAIGERCPACGMMPADHAGPPTLTYEGQLTAWAVELTRASTTPGEAASEVGARLRTLHNALQGLHDGPASDPPAS